MAYPTYGGEGTFVANSVSGAYAVPMPVGLAQNHLIILPTYINKVAAPSITPAYTETGRAGGFTVSTRIAGASEGDASVTYSTFSAGNVQFGLAIGVSGADTTTPYEGVVQLAASGASTSVASTTITTTGAERLLVYLVAVNDDTATTEVTLNGWTDEGTFTTIEGSDAALRLYTLQAATAGTYTTPSFTLAASEYSDRIGLAVIPAASSGSQTITAALVTNAQSFFGATVERGASRDRGDGAHSSASERRERRKQNSRTRNAVYQEAEEARAKALADALAAIDEPVEPRPKPKKKRAKAVVASEQAQPTPVAPAVQSAPMPAVDYAARATERAATMALIAAQDDEDEIEVLMLLSAA